MREDHATKKQEHTGREGTWVWKGWVEIHPGREDQMDMGTETGEGEVPISERERAKTLRKGSRLAMRFG